VHHVLEAVGDAQALGLEAGRGVLREAEDERVEGGAELLVREAGVEDGQRARAEERAAVEAGKLQGSAARLESELGAVRRKLAELEAERGARAAELEKVRADLQGAQAEAERRRQAAAADAGEVERRHAAEASRLKAAMVELEKHLEARARAELGMKKRIQELEKAAAAPRPPPVPAADPAEVARLKAAVARVEEELGDLRGENDFLNGEVARYQQKNRDLQAQLDSLREV
jgi:chromosome segregation ATPase